MRKIDTENGVSNFSSGGRVVVMVMGNGGGTRYIVRPFEWGILFTHYPPVGTSASHCSINRTLMGERLDRNRRPQST